MADGLGLWVSSRHRRQAQRQHARTQSPGPGQKWYDVHRNSAASGPRHAVPKRWRRCSSSHENETKSLIRCTLEAVEEDGVVTRAQLEPGNAGLRLSHDEVSNHVQLGSAAACRFASYSILTRTGTHSLIHIRHQRLAAKLSAYRSCPISPSDTVHVQVKIKEGDKERVQAFEGTVIVSKNGAKGFTVRKMSRPGRRANFPWHWKWWRRWKKSAWARMRRRSFRSARPAWQGSSSA